MSHLSLSKPRIDSVSSLYKSYTKVDVLRLDLVHPEIAGNKWYKLQYYLSDAIATGIKNIISFGGAYSNHLIATACACKGLGLNSIGIVRGERPAQLSHSLAFAEAQGMRLHFVSREDYRTKKLPAAIHETYDEECIIIPEGGYGTSGVKGASEILNEMSTDHYTHIFVAVGTGTTMAGLLKGAASRLQVIGIPVLKNHETIDAEILALLDKPEQLHLFKEYHFGGYAKQNYLLLEFMNNLYRQTGIPSDFVYTGKLFFAVDDLLKKNVISPDSSILIIHSGGLQGNASLPKGTLIF